MRSLRAIPPEEAVRLPARLVLLLECPSSLWFMYSTVFCGYEFVLVATVRYLSLMDPRLLEGHFAMGSRRGALR